MTWDDLDKFELEGPKEMLEFALVSANKAEVALITENRDALGLLGICLCIDSDGRIAMLMKREGRRLKALD